MQKNKIVFLIRAYNESSRIISVMESIFRSGFDQVLIVDDGSKDGTRELLSEHFDGKYNYIRHSINRGAGAALETGFEFIRRFGEKNGWEYVVTFDADGQHDIGDIEKFLHYLQKHPAVKVVFGSRFIEKTRSNVPVVRKGILWGGKIFTSLISGVRLTDAHNGYRLFHREVIEKVRLTMDGMEYASELIDQIHFHGYMIGEVPVNIHYDEYTLGKGQRHGGALRIAFRMIWSKFFR